MVLADSAGYYHIHAKGNDTISFSFLGYYTETYVVPLRLIRIIHDIELIPRTRTLTEVQINALTPYQRDSLDRLETFKHYLDQPKTYFIEPQMHSVYDIPNPNYNDAFGISLNPFTFFSKKNREKRKFSKMYPEFERQALFLYKFRPSYEFARVSTDLVFWSWIKIQYHAWIKPK